MSGYNRIDCLFHCLRRVRTMTGIPQQHSRSCQNPQRANLSLTGQVFSGIVQLIQGIQPPPVRGKLRTAKLGGYARKLCQFIRQNVTEHISRQDHIEVLRSPDHIHGSRINKAVFQCNLRILRCKPGDRLPPQHTGCQNIGLIQADQPACAL